MLVPASTAPSLLWPLSDLRTLTRALPSVALPSALPQMGVISAAALAAVAAAKAVVVALVAAAPVASPVVAAVARVPAAMMLAWVNQTRKLRRSLDSPFPCIRRLRAWARC